MGSEMCIRDSYWLGAGKLVEGFIEGKEDAASLEVSATTLWPIAALASLAACLCVHFATGREDRHQEAVPPLAAADRRKTPFENVVPIHFAPGAVARRAAAVEPALGPGSCCAHDAVLNGAHRVPSRFVWPSRVVHHGSRHRLLAPRIGGLRGRRGVASKPSGWATRGQRESEMAMGGSGLFEASHPLQ